MAKRSHDGSLVGNDEKKQRLEDPFDIWGVPDINSDYQKSEIHYIETNESINDTGPIKFEFSTLGGSRLDPNFTELEGDLEIWDVAQDKKTVEADDVGVINSLPITMFQKIEIKINDQLVTDSSTGNHALKAYFQQKFTYNKSVKQEILKKTEFYFEEDPDALNHHTKTEENAVFKQKHDIFVKNANSVKFRTQLYCDEFNTPKYFPTDCHYVITLTRQPTSFCLMGVAGHENKYKIKIKRLRLVVKKILPAKPIVDNDEDLFTLGKTAYIPYTQGIVTSRNMEKGNYTKNHTDVCLGGFLPKQMFVFFIDHDAFSGTITKNPFEFKNHDLQKIKFTVEGIEYPTVPYDLNFLENDVTRAYLDLLNTIGISRDNKSPNITLEMFKKYCAVFCLDLQPDQCNSYHIHQSNPGRVNVELTFRTPLPNTITVCFYSLHDKVITFKRLKDKGGLNEVKVLDSAALLDLQ